MNGDADKQMHELGIFEIEIEMKKWMTLKWE